MEFIWYIIVDMDGEEIHTSNREEAETAFRCDGIVTIVQESIMRHGDLTVSTRIFSDMKKSDLKG